MFSEFNVFCVLYVFQNKKNYEPNVFYVFSLFFVFHNKINSFQEHKTNKPLIFHTLGSFFCFFTRKSNIIWVDGNKKNFLPLTCKSIMKWEIFLPSMELNYLHSELLVSITVSSHKNKNKGFSKNSKRRKQQMCVVTIKMEVYEKLKLMLICFFFTLFGN